jgi:hypothetical protein
MNNYIRISDGFNQEGLKWLRKAVEPALAEEQSMLWPAIEKEPTVSLHRQE